MKNKRTMTTKKTTSQPELSKVADEVISEVEQVVEVTEKKFEETVEPVRKSIIKRFPVLFLLAVTFGITATLTGMEQLLIKYEILHQNPSIILVIGIGILVLTGTIYKKLG